MTRGERKPTDNDDNVVSNFKVGDWVVKKDGDNFYGGDKFTRITAIDENGRYWLDCGTWVRSNEIRLWTIADAQDGDVLASEPIAGYSSPFVAICKEYDLDSFNSHCFIGFDGYFYNGEDGHTIGDIIHPATKEQRDMLFQKMKDAGYEWDDKEKGLKKI